MSKKIMNGLSMIFLVLVLASIVFANPNAINIQGKLTSSSGTLQTGTFNFSFKIYDNYTSGTLLYETTINATTDARGIYDVILQDINLPFDQQYYLGVTVGTDAEMTPRVNLTSVPYTFSANKSRSLNTSDALTVGGGFSEGGLTIEPDGDILTNGDIIFSGNITVVNITKLNVNGSLSPSIDATFDVGNGTNRWRNANFSGFLQAATIIADTIISPGLSTIWNRTGANVFLANGGDNVGIGTTTPQARLDISDSEDTEFIRLSDETNSDSVGIYTGSGNPEGAVSAQRGSLYLDHASGTLYRKNSDIGATSWVDVGSSSSSTANATAHLAKMTRNSNQTIPTATWTKVNFSTVVFDVGSITNDVTTNATFNITKAGKYLVSAGLALDQIDDTESVILNINVNGNFRKSVSSFSPGADSDLRVEATEVLDLNIGDHVDLYVFHNEGANINTTSETNTQPRLSVVQLDPSLAAAGGWVDGNGSVFLDDSSQNVSAGTLSVDNTANYVGIGTATPNYKLEVIGNINATNLNLTGNIRASDLSNCSAIETDFDGNFICGNDSDGGGDVVGAGGVGNISYWTAGGTIGNSTLFQSNGNIGIGTTNPQAKLDINASGNDFAITLANTDVIGFRNTTGSVISKLYTGANNNLFVDLNASGEIIFRTKGDQERLRIDAGGNIGINTSNPGALLEITAGEDSEFIRITDATNADQVGIFAGSGSPEGNVVAQRGSIYLDHSGGQVYKKDSDVGSDDWTRLATLVNGLINSTAWNKSVSNIILANNNDNVGLGTNNPTERLVVVGNANITQNVTVGSLNTTGVVTASSFRGDGTNITGLNIFNKGNVTEYLGGSEANASILKTGNLTSIFTSSWSFANNGTFVLDNATIVRTTNLGNVLTNNSDANITTLNVVSLPLGWVNLTNYPGSCATGEFVTAVGDTLTCGSIGVAASTAGGWSNNSDDTFTSRNVLIDSNLFYANTSTDRVGIGTDLPQYKFQVAETGGANVNLSDTLYIQGTNLGIGTSAPSEKLVVIGSVNISDSLNVSGTVQATSFIGDGSLITGLNVFNRENVTEYLGGADINGTIIKVTNISGFLQSVDAVFNADNLTEFIGNNASIIRTSNLTLLQSVNAIFNTGNLTEFIGSNASIVRADNITALQAGNVTLVSQLANDAGYVTSGFSNNTDINVTGFVANQTLFVNDSLVGIGTNSPTKKLEVSNESDAITIDPNAQVPTINTTHATENKNITITSADGSVIIQLG